MVQINVFELKHKRPVFHYKASVVPGRGDVIDFKGRACHVRKIEHKVESAEGHHYLEEVNVWISTGK